jgi:hypothetical protein
MYRSSSWIGVRPPHDVEHDRLVCIAAETADFEVAVTSIECIAQHGRWLRRTIEAKHALIPRLAGEPIGDLAGFVRPFGRHQN